MKKKLFVDADFEIWNENGRFFVIYDAGAHQVIMRKDEITVIEANLVCSGEKSPTDLLFSLQQRMIERGTNPYISNI